MSNLSNDDLKEQLIEWESFYTNLVDWYDFYVSGGKKYFEYLEENALMRNINAQSDFQYGISKFEGSNEHVLKQSLFENILINRVYQNGFILRFYEEAQNRHLNIIKQCETYEN